MYKILNGWIVGKYTLLELDQDLPEKSYDKYLIDGICYKPIPVYDLPRHIAIEGNGDFKEKTVKFI